MIPHVYQHLPPTLDINQVCDVMTCSRRTVYNWMNLGRVEWVLSPSGQRLVLTASLWRDPEVVTMTNNAAKAQSRPRGNGNG